MLGIMAHAHSSWCTRGLDAEDRLLHYLPDRPLGGCWIFTGTESDAGYGLLIASIDGSRRQWRAHRLAYRLWVGVIPDGLTIDHVATRGCTSRLCCNPAHLEAVTNGINSLRGHGPWAENARKEKCLRGHDFDIERRVGDKVYRGCSICVRIRGRKNEGYAGVGSGRRDARRSADGRFAQE